MRWTFMALLVLAACEAQIKAHANPQPTPNASLPDYGVAPELTNAVWLNSAQPIRLAELRGKVVLLDMWTFG